MCHPQFAGDVIDHQARKSIQQESLQETPYERRWHSFARRAQEYLRWKSQGSDKSSLIENEQNYYCRMFLQS